VTIGPAIQVAFRLLRVGSLEKVAVPLPAAMAEEP